MIFGIASYRRPQCRTVKTLLEAGIPAENIVISVQDEKDLTEYSAIHKGIRIIYRKADSAAGNRNTLLQTIKERPICLLDDDITSVGYRVTSKGFRACTKQALEALDSLCEEAQKNGCVVAGVSPTGNNIVASARETASVDVLLQGSFLIFLSDALFDGRYKMVEDYELCLRLIAQGQHTIRFNHYVANKPKNGTNEGGLHERYASGELPRWIRSLERQYSIFKANSAKTGGYIKWR